MATSPRDTGAKRSRRGKSLRAFFIIGRVSVRWSRMRRSWKGWEKSCWSPPIARPGTSRLARTAGVYWRADPNDISILDGRDDQKRAALIAERLTHWKSFRNT